jgi:PAP2 superfamily
MSARKSLSVVLAVAGLTFGSASASAHSRSSHAATGWSGSNAVVDWNASAGRAALAACIAPADDPLHESRMYAMTHIAIHDALNAIDRRSTPYAANFRVPRWTSARAAVASAARNVMVALLQQLPAPFPQSCLDAGVQSVEADYAAALLAIPDGRAKDVGLAAGSTAAHAVLALRSADGSDTPLIDGSYPQGTTPGVYRFTPDRPFAFAPGWANVTPFALSSSSQFKAPPPYPVNSKRYARDLAEVKRLGGDGVTTPSQRTPDQTQIALFWVESSPLAWNRIARTLATKSHLDLWDQSRLFGLLNIALADGYIGSWQSKFQYNFWRPVTAIREAASDGNPRTTADPTWTPLLTTPPIPDQDSAHAVEGAAAAQVFRSFFRTDHFRFSACSLTLPTGTTCNDANPVLRQFTRFSQAAAENAASRVYVGIHFRRATDTGLVHGRRIAKAVVHKTLQPHR